MKILVTGADGFIGSHLTEKLITEGYNVTALCQYNSFNSIGNLKYIDKKKLRSVEIIFGDIRDKNFVEKNLKNKRFIFHLAALIGIPHSYESYYSYLDTNVLGTLNILDSVRKNGSFLIHTSTSEVYGSAQYFPMDEKHPLNAQSPYAATKIAADQLAMSFQRSYDLPITIIRPFNTFGPRQSNRAIIPTIINQSMLGSKFITLGNLNTTRDLTYVLDTVQGFELCIKNSNKIIGDVINLGSAYDISVKNLANKILKILKSNSKIKIDKNRIRPLKSEVSKLLSSNNLAKKKLNWKPKFSGRNKLDIGLTKTIQWFIKFNQKDSINPKNYII